MPQQPESRSSTSAPVSPEERHLVRACPSCAVMAVAVDDDLALDLRRPVVRRVLDEEFAEEKGLVAKLGGTRIVGQEICQLVAKNGGATGFKDDHRCAGGELGSEGVEGFEQVLLRRVEHAEVIERAAEQRCRVGSVTRKPAPVRTL